MKRVQKVPREALIKSLSAFILGFLCNARNGKGNSELFKESHDEAVHKNSYESRLYELISASLTFPAELSKEALIKSLFAFILEFLCNARNGLTRIASYLRKPMTKQCIKILIKENSMN